MYFRHEQSMQPVREGVTAAKDSLDALCKAYEQMPLNNDGGAAEQGRIALHKQCQDALARLTDATKGRRQAYADYTGDSPASQTNPFPRAALTLSDDQQRQADEAGQQAAAWRKQELASRGHFD